MKELIWFTKSASLYLKIILFLVLSSLQAHKGASQTVKYFFDEARQALADRNYVRYDSMIQHAFKLFPQHPHILWHTGKAAALNGRTDTAFHYLKKAINTDTRFNLSEADLNAIWNHSLFPVLEAHKAALEKVIIGSDTAFVVLDRQLHLESAAYDAANRVLYGGSIRKRKIIRIDRDGNVTDFTQPGEGSLGAVFGLKVDSKRKILWACSSPMREMQDYDSTLRSAVHKFDLRTGNLLAVFYPDDTLKNHVFGDLILNREGTPFVSDSRNNVIYTLDLSKGALTTYLTSPDFWNLQGMAFSPKEDKMYIADYLKGLFVLDLRTSVLIKMKVPYEIALKGADGIYYYNNSLITIQNGVYPNRVIRNFLSEDGNEFSHFEYIDNNHPAFGEPTIGTLSGKTFYYIANSQWNGYENGTIKSSADLQPIVILKHVFR